TIHTKKTPSGTHSASRPLNASGPVLKNSITPPGTDRPAVQKLSQPAHRGNTGSSLGSMKIASPTARYQTASGDQSKMNRIHPRSLKDRVVAADTSPGRKAA